LLQENSSLAILACHILRLEYSKMIAQGADSLPPEKQAEVLDFIKLLKAKQVRAEQTAAPKTTRR